MQSKLATILCTDVVGYSKHMQADELGTLRNLDSCRKIIDPLIKKHQGRIFNTAGDSVLAEFASAADAVRFSHAMQTSKLSLRWRIGLHLGEVWIYGDNLMGDTVNIAARVEAMADYGGVCMTEKVYEQVSGKLPNLSFSKRGSFNFKNMAQPYDIYGINIAGAEPNPNAQTAEPPDHSIKDPKVLVKQVLTDASAQGKSLDQALMLKRDKKFGPTVRILMWRTVKGDNKSLDELLDMASKRLVPIEYRNHVVSIFDEYCKKSSSERLMKIASVLEDGHLGNHRGRSMVFWSLAGQTNPDAAFKYGSIILSDPHSSPAEIAEAMSHMEEAANSKNVHAAMIVGKHYLDAGQKPQAFKWFWCARAWGGVGAQANLEQLTKGFSAAEFQNLKYAAEALLDQINFSSQDRILS